MNGRRDHWEEETLGAYVLGACPPDEADRVARHLDACPSCASEAARLRKSATALLADVAPVAPAAELKDRVMADIRAEADLFDAARARTHASPPARRAARAAARWRGSWQRLGRPARVGAVACTLVLAVGAGGLVASGLRSDPGSREMLRAQVNQARAPGAAGILEVRDDEVDLRVRGLPRPEPGRGYQVWVRTGREVPRPAGAFLEPQADGESRATLPPAARDADQVLVTSEPAAGSEVPTGVPLVRVDL